MKPLNHRQIFLQTLDGFFAPLVGAIKGAVTEIQRPSTAGRARPDHGEGRKTLAEPGDESAPTSTGKRRTPPPRRR